MVLGTGESSARMTKGGRPRGLSSAHRKEHAEVAVGGDDRQSYSLAARSRLVVCWRSAGPKGKDMGTVSNPAVRSAPAHRAREVGVEEHGFMPVWATGTSCSFTAAACGTLERSKDTILATRYG